MRSILLNDRAVELSTTKVYVFSESVLCLGGRIAEYPRSVKSWKDKTDSFTQSPENRDLGSVDGRPVVFEEQYFLHHTAVTSRSPKNGGGRYYSA